MKDIRIDRDNCRIVMTRKFAKKADDPTTDEYRLLQEVKRDNPHFKVVNHTIKKNPNKECYRGLTYNYMRDYIKTHEPKATVESVLAELEDMIFISKCHSNGYRYPTIKKWFLGKYSEVATFGTDMDSYNEKSFVEVNFSNNEESAIA